MMMKTIILAIILGLLVSDTIVLSPQENNLIPSPTVEKEIHSFLQDICDWAIEKGMGSGELDINGRRTRSIFINSNLARVLLAAYELGGNRAYLEKALQWFDVLVLRQQLTIAQNGKQTGFWQDGTKNSNIYLGDAGTAASALAGAVRYADKNRQTKYLAALERYADFIRYGSHKDPQGKNRGGSNGWIIEQGADKGALGCGYYRNELSTAPYTIATSNSGAAFFAAMYTLTGNPDYKDISTDAVRWLMKKRKPSGEFPYILHHKINKNWPLDTMSYVTDGILFAYYHNGDQHLNEYLEKNLNKSVQWLIIEQNKSGTWGKLRSEDQQRSPGVLNLLVWYYNHLYKNQYVLKSIQRNYNYYLNAKNAKQFGVFDLPVAAGFVGISMAEILETGITYRLKNELFCQNNNVFNASPENE